MHRIGHDLDRDPSFLRGLEKLVAAEEVFLCIESLDNYTHKKIEEEHRDYDNEDDKDDDHVRRRVLLRLQVDANRICSVPHNPDPALCRLHREKSEQTPERVIEVQIWIQPLTAGIDAVPLVHNAYLPLTVAQMLQVISVASVKLAREQRRLQDSEQKHEKEDDHLQVGYLRDRVD